MSFREPTVLFGLALLPVALLAYLAMQRRHGRRAAAFGNPALLPALMTARPGWRRHLPAALLALALAAQEEAAAWLLVMLAAFGGLTVPPLIASARVVWPQVVPAEMHTRSSLRQSPAEQTFPRQAAVFSTPHWAQMPLRQDWPAS